MGNIVDGIREVFVRHFPPPIPRLRRVRRRETRLFRLVDGSFINDGGQSALPADSETAGLRDSDGGGSHDLIPDGGLKSKSNVFDDSDETFSIDRLGG